MLRSFDRLHPLDRSAATIPKSPPLLRASMVMAMTRTELDSRDIPADCALAQAARRRLDDSIWCTWSTRTWDERWIEPTVERLRSKQRDTSSIARSLALPHRTLDATMRALDATMPRANGQPLEAGDLVVPGYSLHQVLGRGVQSTVFRARRVRDGATVALKVVPVIGGADECARLHRALDRIEPVDHPRILVPTARGTLPGDIGIWLDMELCRGSMLDVLSEMDTPLSVPDAWQMVFEALSGLAHLHDRGIVHGDIRPENLLVRSDGSAVIADLGLATCRSNTTQPRSAAGAPRFAPPERFLDNVHSQLTSDVWSMAATLYFLLTLEPPRDEYAGQSQLEATRCNPIVPIAMRRPDVPPGLACCIDRALSVDPRTRPINAGFFRDQLMSPERSVGSVEIVGSTRDRGPVTESQAPTITAPGGSVRAIRSRSRRRQTLVGMTSFLGSIAGLCLAGLLVAGSSKGSSAPAPRYVGVAQTSMDVSPAAPVSARAPALACAPAPARAPAPAPSPDAAALPEAMQAPLDLAECVEHPREVTACDELSAQKK